MELLKSLFQSVTGVEPESCEALAKGGSRRQYFRLRAGRKSLVGVLGTDKDENNAFITLSKHFRSKGIPVPEVLASSPDLMAYVQEDLGDDILFDRLRASRDCGEYCIAERELLRRAIAALPKIQFEGAQGLDFGICYPQSRMDARNIDFDLNYFKYCFLKESKVEFNELLLQDDFEKLKTDLLACDTGDTFMFRDFQSRNVMIVKGMPYFIDFQGGRKGPIYYDVASFIWQARSRFPEDLKEYLVSSYLEELKQYIEVDEADFREKLRLFVLFRTLQVLGAYGFRGKIERKEHFLKSIPFALENLKSLGEFPQYPYLNTVLAKLCEPAPKKEDDGLLHIDIYSFSFRKGIPEDNSGNGGGYVFDCRSVHNPGRYERFRNSSGLDADVIEFLENDGEIFPFLESAYSLVDAHTARFLERGFTHLQISFGCTGGHHRSVYSAERMAEHLKEKFPQTVVRVMHRELE